MKARLLLYLAVALPLLLVGGTGIAQKDDKGKANKDGDALFERAKAFVAAFDKGDAKAVAGFWVEDGDYTDQSGKHLKGRAAIQKAFAGMFAESKGAKLRIDSEALRFVTPDVAIEDGVTEVIPPDGGPPSRARYTIVHVKKDGKWSLSSVRDAAFAPPTNYEHLRGLEGLVGDWDSEADKGEVARLSFAWAHGQNFLVAHFTTSFKNINMGGGTQWIGWDPLAKKVRSWTFESSGGFAEGTWSHDGKTWTVKTSAVLSDGVKASATNVLTLIDANTISLSSKDRTLNGKAMPELKEVRLKRRK
jgi:uncharacterized protein (TIGR02246 family)